MNFQNKVLIIGYGAVARSTLPILLEHVTIPPDNITIIDSKNKESDLSVWIEKGIKFSRILITPKNLDQVLFDNLSKGDLLIDLSLNIDCTTIVNWCNSHEVLYINASVEVWDPYSEGEITFPYEKTLHYRHMKLQAQSSEWNNATTCIVDHGANPGLISHFAKKGLVDIADTMITDGKILNPQYIRNMITEKRYSDLAMEIGIKVIHCSEIDTQSSKKARKNDEFINTWSIEGFHEEAIAPAEIGWGTHENDPPLYSYRPPDGPDNELILKRMGMNTWIRSWTPHQEITGMVIRHGEAYGISDRWTVWREGKAVYRPTVSYVYRPCDATIESLNALRTNNYQLPASLRILDVEEIHSGADTLGALLMGHPYTSWWTGSILSIEKAKQLVPGQNATTIQVGIGLVAAVMWMIENPQEGFCLPDDLPYEYILDIATPYLGEFHSCPSDWTPVRNQQENLPENIQTDTKNDWLWQFNNFLS
jgi:homospermidine synthase